MLLLAPRALLRMMSFLALSEVIMKRLFIALLLTLFLATVAWASAGRSVGNTADAAITIGTGYLNKIIVHADGKLICTFAAYDHPTAASGNKIFSTWTVSTLGTQQVFVLTFDDEECLYFNGIYIDITTTDDITYDVYFSSK